MATPLADRFARGRTRKRALLAVAVSAALAAAFLGACTRESPHEIGTLDTQYEDIDVRPGFSATASTDLFYDGKKSVKIAYDGSTCACDPDHGAAGLAYAFGTPGEPGSGFRDGYDGYMGGAYYLPKDFDANQNGYVEILRWDNKRQYGGGADKGGIAIDPSTHKGLLFRAGINDVQGDAGFQQIGSQFDLPRDQWADVYIHQLLRGSTGADASSEVFVNGTRVVDAPGVTNSQGRGFDRLVYGLPAVSAAQAGTPLQLWFDRAYASNADPPPPLKPNIIVIVTDDQRWNTTTTDVMPNLRRLFLEGDSTAPGGTYFPNAYATTPECCPSRSSIFTGRYAHNHGLRQVAYNDPTSLAAFNSTFKDFTLQHYLKARSYKTAIFGKYLNGWFNEAPPDFDEYSVLTDLPNYGYCPIRVFEGSNGTGVANQYGNPPVGTGSNAYCAGNDPTSYSTPYLGSKAVDFLGRTNGPFFMYVAPFAPHPLYTPAEQYNNLPVTTSKGPAFHEADLSDKPPYVRAQGTCCDFPPSNPNANETTREEYRKDQLRALKSVDDMVGSIFSTLRSRGQEDNTLAIFVSDNGYLWSDHWLEGKLAPYSYSTHVPLYMRWPGHILASGPNPAIAPRTDGRLVANIDIAPTIMGAVQPAISPSAARPPDGKSLLDPTWKHNFLLLEYKQDTPPLAAAANLRTWNALRSAHWQYTRNDDPSQPDGFFREYYSDIPSMLNNVYGGDGVRDPSDPAEPAPPDAELNQAMSCSGSTPPGGYPSPAGANPCP